MTNFKKSIIRDRNYLDWLRDKRCAATGKNAPSDPAHVRYGSGGGMGMKPGDNFALPLNPDEHREQHRIGEINFWRLKIMQDDWLVMHLIRLYANEFYNEYKQLSKSK